MVLFLIWLALFLLAVLVLTNVLSAIAMNQYMQPWLASMSQSQFRRSFITWSIMMALLGIGWVIMMSWPPSVENVLGFFSRPIQVLPWVLPAAAYGSLLVPFWKESKRRRQTRGNTDP